MTSASHPIAPADAVRSLDAQHLRDALRAVLAPMARLAVARGMPYAEVDELIKGAFVEAAQDAHAGIAAHRSVSRVSVATGINRREVTRLVQPQPASVSRKSPANGLFTRWLSDPRFRVRGATLTRLPRTGQHPSFQSLAESVSRDVKPRTYLEELCRLGLVRLDDRDDHVELLAEKFVPSTDEAQMVGFLGDNVGDHLAAAVANVVSRSPIHLEQALFADELSGESVATVRPLIEQEWKQLVQRFAPLLQQCIDRDRAEHRLQDQRLRIGLYAFTAPAAAASPAAHSEFIASPPSSRRTP